MIFRSYADHCTCVCSSVMVVAAVFALSPDQVVEALDFSAAQPSETIAVPPECNSTTCVQAILDGIERSGVVIQFTDSVIRPDPETGNSGISISNRTGVTLDGFRTDGVVLRINESRDIRLVRGVMANAPALTEEGEPSIDWGAAVQSSISSVQIDHCTFWGSQASALTAFGSKIQVKGSTIAFSGANGFGFGNGTVVEARDNTFYDNATGTDQPVLRVPNPELERQGENGLYYYQVVTARGGLAYVGKITGTCRRGVPGTCIDMAKRNSRVKRLLAIHAPQDLFPPASEAIGSAYDLIFEGNTVVQEAALDPSVASAIPRRYNLGFHGFASVGDFDLAPGIWADIESDGQLVRGNTFIVPPLGTTTDVHTAVVVSEISRRLIVTNNRFATTTGQGAIIGVWLSNSRDAVISNNTIYASLSLSGLSKFDARSAADQSDNSLPFDSVRSVRFLGQHVVNGQQLFELVDIDSDKTVIGNPSSPQIRAALKKGKFRGRKISLR
jgi:hypothetical protein